MMNLPYGELAIGQRSRSRGRTITETDVVNFCAMTGNWLEIHANAEFAKKSMFGQRVVQGEAQQADGNAKAPQPRPGWRLSPV